MDFASPFMLGLLVLVAALVAGYVVTARRRGDRAAQLAREGLVLTPSSRRIGRKRHLPFALVAVALTLLVFAMARPRAEISTPQRTGTVVLAFDTSNSMRADDLAPTRLVAAKQAAKAFVDEQPKEIKVGVVAFGDSAVVLLEPSVDRDDVLAAIDGLTPGGGTSLGQGLFASLGAIAGKPIVVDEKALASDSGQVDIGFFGAATIIVLSDGENTGEPDPSIIADLASSAGVTVHTIGIGTSRGTVVRVDGFSVSTALDGEQLEAIAAVTDGEYHEAADTEALTEIYRSIDLELTTVREYQEISALFTVAGAVLLTLASLLSVVWLGRVV
jgi:Ca-activated chloride channel family protein